MTEILSNDNGNGSGDELSASGGFNSSFDEKSRRKLSLSGKTFCNSESLMIKIIGTKKLNTLWTDVRAMAVALTNFQKICGSKMNVVFCFSGLEEDKQSETHKFEKYVADLKHELHVHKVGEGSKLEIEVEFKNDEILMYGIRNIYKFVEIQ